MKRQTKNEKAAEDIVHALRQDNCAGMMNFSDDELKKTVLSILELWYKPVSSKKQDTSWKATRDQCS